MARGLVSQATPFARKINAEGSGDCMQRFVPFPIYRRGNILCVYCLCEHTDAAVNLQN